MEVLLSINVGTGEVPFLTLLRTVIIIINEFTSTSLHSLADNLCLKISEIREI